MVYCSVLVIRHHGSTLWFLRFVLVFRFGTLGKFHASPPAPSPTPGIAVLERVIAKRLGSRVVKGLVMPPARFVCSFPRPRSSEALGLSWLLGGWDIGAFP